MVRVGARHYALQAMLLVTPLCRKRSETMEVPLVASDGVLFVDRNEGHLASMSSVYCISASYYDPGHVILHLINALPLECLRQYVCCWFRGIQQSITLSGTRMYPPPLGASSVRDGVTTVPIKALHPLRNRTIANWNDIVRHKLGRDGIHNNLSGGRHSGTASASLLLPSCCRATIV